MCKMYLWNKDLKKEEVITPRRLRQVMLEYSRKGAGDGSFWVVELESVDPDGSMHFDMHRYLYPTPEELDN